MLTLKEQLIQDIRYMSRDKELKTIETLYTGAYNEMIFSCPQEELLLIINNSFDDDLDGISPSGIKTKINGWDFVDKDYI